jgi:hypothetical protein
MLVFMYTAYRNATLGTNVTVFMYTAYRNATLGTNVTVFNRCHYKHDLTESITNNN